MIAEYYSKKGMAELLSKKEKPNNTWIKARKKDTLPPSMNDRNTYLATSCTACIAMI